MGAALYRCTAATTQCPSTAGTGTSLRGNSECARCSQGGPGSHGQLGRKSLGCAAGTSPRRSSGSARGDRAAPGWLALVAISRPLSPLATQPRTAVARGKSFRPTASRPSREEKQTTKTKIHPAPRSPLADISTWQKTGHFYFALTPGQSEVDTGGRQAYGFAQR